MATKSIPENRVLQQEEDSHVEDYDDDEAEETLSLSDLPLYSINHHAAATTNRHHNHRRHHEDFEFFSEDFTASTRRAPPESIVFCGKIIHPYRESPRFEKKNLQHSRIGNSYSWVPKSKVSKVVKNSVAVQYSSKSNPNNKWYLFKFGLGSKSSLAEMELRDNKGRRRSRVASSGSGLWGLLTSLRRKTSRYLAT